MVRAPCCDETRSLKKGPWMPEEDKLLVDYIRKHGCGSWRRLPRLAGLNRCGKSCRLRWTNYLRPDIKRGHFSEDEEKLIIHLHSVLGNKWSCIAAKLQGRTDNEIKNYWNTRLRKKLLNMGIDPVTHKPRTDLGGLLACLPGFLAAANVGGSDVDALKMQADAAHLAKLQLAQSLLQVLTATSPSPNLDLVGLLGSINSSLRSHHLSDLLQTSHQYEGMLNGSPLGAQASLSSFEFGDLGAGGCSEAMITATAAIHGSSSAELGFDQSNGASSTAALILNVAPSLAPASPENNDEHVEAINSSGVSAAVSPASGLFAGLEGLINMDDLDSDLGWKHLLEQTAWWNSP